jgi:myo-inositol-1-phosphate synthase
MATKESSIVWFIKQFNAYGTENFKTLFKKEIEQAKEMHKQEIIDARANSPILDIESISDYVIEAEQYYNITFRK